jgi:hypothetical protein
MGKLYIKQIALEKGYKYVPLKILEQSNNYAWGLFENVGVTAHPSDLECKT